MPVIATASPSPGWQCSYELQKGPERESVCIVHDADNSRARCEYRAFAFYAQGGTEVDSLFETLRPSPFNSDLDLNFRVPQASGEKPGLPPPHSKTKIQEFDSFIVSIKCLKL